MYTEQDYQSNRKQLKKRAIALGIPAVILLAGVIWSFIVRIKLLTMGLTIVLGIYGIFCYGMLLFPVIAYGRHMYNILYGRTHTLTGYFKEMEDAIVVREGVEYRPMLMSVNNLEDAEDDRLFYYDANLPKPDWQIGEKLTLTAHDKSVGKWERV